MRNLPRRIAIGILGAGTIVAMTAGATTAAASAAVATRHHCARTEVRLALQWPAVREGAQGNRVYVIQYLLNYRGYKVAIDGKFGKATTDAVKNFQGKVGLKPVDGIVGAATWEKLIATVKFGDNNLAVKAVQWDLKHAYGKDVPVDGKFEAKTKKAVIEIQTQYLPRDPHDGVVNDKTWNALIVKKL
jgi:peptidoglycan hydrolase-like protein with peptidoglycan-binding domain